MRDTLRKSLKNLKWFRIQRNRLTAIVLVLSLIVTANVFWALRQPGLTLAGDADCRIPEHTHKDECFTQVNICGLSEEAHIHEEACYTTQFVEAQETSRLVCSQTEVPHVHGEGCYTTQFTESQETHQLVCDQTEPSHAHSDSCYEIVTADPVETTVLICELQFETHEHTESCYVLDVTEAHEEQLLICELSETAHVHEEACYIRELHCEQQEHVHTVECYSDETADVETLLDWQNMFADYPYTEDLREDLVGIAKSQVGYTESTRNFEVDSDGIRHGYTRYGAWYGTPYREWSAAFVSFCLNYAEADPEQTPGNIGANTMATLWNELGRFAPVGEYVPAAGDLVFFEDNTVGIVSEVQNATFYVIRGDVDDAVVTDSIPLTDDSITGWGITEESPSEESAQESQPESVPPSVPVIPTDELLDITNGPAVFIFGERSTEPEAQRFSLKAPRSAESLVAYLQANNGTYSFSLLDTNNQELPKNSDGYYIVTAGTSYKLYMHISSPDGFLPGTYQYQLPAGLSVLGGTGDFILEDGANVGSWDVSNDGLITTVFNSNANVHSEVTITATMGITFLEQNSTLNFDGKIKVSVDPPPQQETTTKLNKWANQGDETDPDESDPTKLYWTMTITGNQNSRIPGSVITDHIKTGDHRYTQSDMDAGIKIGATDPNGDWHSWTVYPGDPNLTWTETGWTYTIPETITCWCGQVALGNDNWIYYVDYTSTPTPANITGSFWYTNEVTLDGQYFEGWGEFAHSGTDGGIVKTGNFHGDANGGAFLWEFQVTIPGRLPGTKAAYYTQIVDQLYVKDQNNATVAYIENDADNATVTAVYNGETIPVPHVSDATSEDEFAWFVGWTNESNGASYTIALLPLCRCHCTEASCHYWNANLSCCGAYHYLNSSWSGFCYCWTPEEAIPFTFSYTTNDPAIIEAYGGRSNHMLNQARLEQTIYKPDGSEGSVIVGEATAEVPIPGIFKKELTRDFDGYTAHYKITVNEAKLALTSGSPFTIHDVMTDTLAYIRGSLVITSEDAAGNISSLQEGTDYTVTYDGTGTQTDGLGNPVHVMDIVILHPQPVMYILDYDATLVIPQGTTHGVKYSNSASITLWDEVISSSTAEKVYANINISAKRYNVQLFKTSAATGNLLPGATFGLFNDHDGLITSEVTDENGEIFIQTNVTEGIILREHVLYYMQEMQAPPGYQLDDTKYWFCFCDKEDAYCSECETIIADVNAFRIPFEQIGKVSCANQPTNYHLPATGGPGIYPLILVSILFITVPLVYASLQHNRRERRGI